MRSPFSRCVGTARPVTSPLPDLSVCDLWPGLDTVAATGNASFSVLSVPPLRNVSLVFKSVDDMRDYITAIPYGDTPNLPPVFSAVELIQGDSVLSQWTYAIHMNYSMIPDTGMLQVPYLLHDTLSDDSTRYMYVGHTDADGNGYVSSEPRYRRCVNELLTGYWATRWHAARVGEGVDVDVLVVGLRAARSVGDSPTPLRCCCCAEDVFPALCPFSSRLTKPSCSRCSTCRRMLMPRLCRCSAC